jgi:uncharacterized damage-inducible protein DinB
MRVINLYKPLGEKQMKVSRIFKHWEQVHADLYTTMDKFSDDELTFAPFNGSWLVGQIMLHIADCEDNWLHGVVRHEIHHRGELSLALGFLG